jgi:hypothetical protein
MQLRFQVLALGIALAAPCGCAPLGLAPVTPQASVAAPRAGSTVVVGVAIAPQGITGIVPTGGGNIIPTGGGDRWHLQALTQQPLANAQVYLADAAGQPYPLIKPVTTDAQGRFTFTDVPVGVTVMVVATGRNPAGKDATLQTLVRTAELGATANIDTASSLVTLAVVKDQSGDLGEFNASSFRTATDATARQLDDQDVPDLTDRAALLARIDKLAQSVAELKTALDAIRQDLKDIKASLEEIKARLGQPTGGPPHVFAPGDPIPSLDPNPHTPLPVGPNGGEGICAAPTEHELALSSVYPSYPLTLQIITPRGNVLRTITFDKPGATPVVSFVEICPNGLILKDANGTVMAQASGWVIPKGAPRRVTLPI